MARILPFGVLADDYPIEFIRCGGREAVIRSHGRLVVAERLRIVVAVGILLVEDPRGRCDL
ncbi:hypothetical protein ACJ72_05079, partial [Emergomyces africanus]